MFDITKIGPLINHIKNFSNYYKETGKEIIIFCPYCDDATRPKADHGHLYISQTTPVFHCFRCSSSGNLIRLLIDTGFDDEDVLKYLAQFIKYKTTKDYYKSKRKITKLKLIQEDIIKKNIEFEIKYKNQFEIYKSYLNNRLGNMDYSQFLISPTFFNNKLCCMFTNSIGEDISIRLIENSGKFRYHLNENTSGKYYFQDTDFDNVSRTVLTEGPFDMINLFLYGSEFENSFFISLNGKKYSGAIESLILEEFLIGDLEINMVFDNDVENFKTHLYRAKMLSKHYNQNIVIRGWKPLIGKDTGDYPAVIEVQ